MDSTSIIIPVYNEETIITENTERLIEFLNQKKLKYEIFLCNNGSTDDTLKLAKRLEKRYRNINMISIPNKGVGTVFKKAVKLAKYDNIISVDMDLSTDLNFIPASIKLLEKYDIVIGSKKMGSQKRSFLRTMPSTIFIFLVKLFLNLPYNDYSMAAKAYKKEAIIKHIDKVDYGTSYVIDLIYFAKRDKRKIIEIPVNCIDKRKSKFNLLHESLYRFKNLIKLAIK
jgi:glycosyltransferase involved in cell wall biosynthesis|tara:strand:- start:833 stop:1513 length:681 start_codon:yes stop_codon:yes gene_type:complete